MNIDKEVFETPRANVSSWTEIRERFKRKGVSKPIRDRRWKEQKINRWEWEESQK